MAPHPTAPIITRRPLCHHVDFDAARRGPPAQVRGSPLKMGVAMIYFALLLDVPL